MTISPPNNLAPHIRTDETNPFAHKTMGTRLPGIIRETQQLNADFLPTVMDALDRLHDELEENRPIHMIEAPAPDYDNWAAAYAPRGGHTWQGTDWFFAETFAYRRFMEAVRWFEFERDPFLPKKTEELNGTALWETLEAALQIPAEPREDRFMALLEVVLWGNRVDLSHPESMAQGTSKDDDLLVDERATAVEHLLKRDGAVHIIADNAGTELTMDLVFAEAVLDAITDRVVVHLKTHPTFVSDAIPADVRIFLDALAQPERSSAAKAFGERLRTAFEEGRLQLAPDFYWNSSRYLWQMPPRLEQVFNDARLTVIKGDANYRRMTSDGDFPHTTPYADVVAYFPSPLVALRTLKSDTVVGLPEGVEEALNAKHDENWRVVGKYGVIQCS